MSSVIYLYLAYLVAILVIGGYVVHLVRQVAAAREAVERLEQQQDR